MYMHIRVHAGRVGKGLQAATDLLGRVLETYSAPYPRRASGHFGITPFRVTALP